MELADELREKIASGQLPRDRAGSAVSSYRSLLKLAPDDEARMHVLARICDTLIRYDLEAPNKVETCTDASASLKEEASLTGLLGLATIAGQEKKLDEQFALIQKARAKWPSNAAAHLAFADFVSAKGDHKKAIDALKMAKAASPGAAPADLDARLGHHYLALRKWEEASRLLQTAIAAAEKDGRTGSAIKEQKLELIEALSRLERCAEAKATAQTLADPTSARQALRKCR
jgi:tetratricopeptide (TPR) repeat protein